MPYLPFGGITPAVSPEPGTLHLRDYGTAGNNPSAARLFHNTGRRAPRRAASNNTTNCPSISTLRHGGASRMATVSDRRTLYPSIRQRYMSRSGAVVLKFSTLIPPPSQPEAKRQEIWPYKIVQPRELATLLQPNHECGAHRRVLFAIPSKQRACRRSPTCLRGLPSQCLFCPIHYVQTCARVLYSGNGSASLDTAHPILD